MARGRRPGRTLRERLTALADRRRAPRRGRAAPAAPRRRDAAPAVRGGRLRRLLLPPSTTPTNLGRMFRPDCRAADRRTGSTCRSATTAAPAPSCVSGHRRRPPAGQRKAPTDDGADVRPVAAARHRGRGRLRRRRRRRARHAGAGGATSPSTSSASAWSTTGPPATCRPGSTCPLGPFLGKSFAHLGLAVGRAAGRAGGRPGRPRRRRTRRRCPTSTTPAQPWGLDIDLEVRLERRRSSRCPPFAAMYWTPAQQLAHMTVNGASLRTGDLYALRHGLAARSASSAARSSS